MTDAYVEQAVRWALDNLGSTDFALLCLKFVEDAYEAGNGIWLDGYGYAGEAAERYGAAEHVGAPPRGAFVFYSCRGTIDGRTLDWGHVGLAVGDGTVVHAWDRVRRDGYLEVEALAPAPGWTKPRYVGWAPVSRILEGHKIVRVTE